MGRDGGCAALASAVGSRKVDVLVCNAGILREDSLDDVDIDKLREQVGHRSSCAGNLNGQGSSSTGMPRVKPCPHTWGARRATVQLNLSIRVSIAHISPMYGYRVLRRVMVLPAVRGQQPRAAPHLPGCEGQARDW